jgi:NhaP-type Na+/H+ or K+/H+ antiporter
METDTLIGLTLIAVLGIGAQWLSWRVQLPSILFLLFAGFGAGALGWIDPDALFGDLLFPVVSMSVGLIMFEGGLTLKLRELKSIGGTLIALITLAPIVTWGIATLLAIYLLGLPRDLALLLGAILVVTGPTVIIPLLRQVRPKGQTASLLKWEGILIDPIGATLALLVFEVITMTDTSHATAEILIVIGHTLLLGIVLGGLGGLFRVQMLKRYWIPDYLQNPVTLMVVLAVFTLSNTLQHESGLLSVTVMGIVLANQRQTHIHHIVEFKENLRVLLISGLFIVLAARINLEEVLDLSWTVAVFVILLIILVRPLSIALATLRSSITIKEKSFLAWMAPRGIVAAAVSSIFSLRLVEQGNQEAAILPTITFIVIVGTVLVYGLSAKWVAQTLQLAEPTPKGLLIVGATPWACAMATDLVSQEIPVLMVDSNWIAISAARMDGMRTYYGSALSDRAMNEMDLSGIGQCIALTPNDETNALISMRFATLFGRGKVYQIVSENEDHEDRDTMAHSLRGRALFKEGKTYRNMMGHLQKGAAIKKTPITEEFTFDDFVEHYAGEAIPLLTITPDGTPKMFTVLDPPLPQAGHTIYSLTLDAESNKDT